MLEAAKSDDMDDESNVWRSAMLDAQDEIMDAGTIDDLREQHIKKQLRSSVGVLAQMLGMAEADGKDEKSQYWKAIMESAQEICDSFDAPKYSQSDVARPRA